MSRGRIILVLGAFAMLGAGGCMYTAEVRNTTDEPVLVRMVQRQALKRDWVMDSVRVPPGERVRLGPARATVGRVIMEAGERTRTEEPGTRKIGAGRTELEVVVAEDGQSLVIRKPEKRKSDTPTDGTPNEAHSGETQR